MASVAQLSLGVQDAERAGAFWAAALGWDRRPPRWDGDDWIVLVPPPGEPGSPIAMDVSESPAEDLPRVHIDLDAGDTPLGDEVNRLIGLGARDVDWPHYPAQQRSEEPPFRVLADTEGNRFCVAGRL